MNITGNTVLITGGASGIGLALAERFLNAGNEVIVCGRRPEKLNEAKQRFPQLHTRVCDVAEEADRKSLLTWVTREFPAFNVLVNNAGIQQRVNLLKPDHDWSCYHQEIAINLEGPIHLTMLFVPHLVRKKNAAIINVSSGLAITPATWAPIYSATKAALHSFTMTLRLQLSKTNVEVVEVLPPAVNTDLGGPGLHTFGVPVDEFADAVFKGFEAGHLEIGYGGTEKRGRASRDEIDQATKHMWEGFLRNNPDFLD
jgi:uncharacterized oxidoreductase